MTLGNQVSGVLSPFLRQRRFAAVRPYLLGRVLDFGCGVGRLARVIHPENYLGVDSDSASLDLARKWNPEHAFLGSLEFDYEAHHATYNTVAALAVIEHTQRPEDLLRKLRLLLVPQGRIVLTTPHPSMAFIHRFGSGIGLFSSEANREHEVLLDRQLLAELSAHAGLALIEYKTFLFGANQLCVLMRT